MKKGTQALKLLSGCFDVEGAMKAKSPFSFILHLLPVKSLEGLLEQIENDEELQAKLNDWLEKVKALE